METSNNNNTVQEITQTAIFEAPIQKVWAAVSTSEGIATWFMPNDFEPAVGHAFHIQSPFGPSSCKVLEIDEPHRLSFSWDTDGWVVTFILKDLGGKTEFTVIHNGWKSPETIVPKTGMKNSVIRETMDKGWAGIVHVRLKKAVEE